MNDYKIKPIFQNNYIPVVFSCDNNFIPYLFVAITSIIQNNRSNSNLDFVIFYTSVSDYNKIKLSRLASENVSIRFLNMRDFMEPYKSLWYTHWSYTEAIYYRFFIPKIFENYEKVLYLDADIVSNIDIKELYNLELGNNYAAAARDYAIRSPQSPGFKYYIYDKYNICPNDYFNSGVMLFNIQKIKKTDFFDKCMNCLEELGTPLYPDQDVLNILFKDKVVFLDYAYNMALNFIDCNNDAEKILKDEELKAYKDALLNPKILHYNGSYRPWKQPWLDYAEYFWQYARMTPFYEALIYENNSLKNFNRNIVANVVYRRRIYLNYLRCRLLNIFSSGDRKTHYQNKVNALKMQIKDYRATLRK